LLTGQLTEAVTQQRYRRRDGSWVWVEISFNLTREEESGEPNGYVAVIRDITQRKQIESEMSRLARHDPLTGLPNRLHFREQLEQEIACTRRTGGGFALFCLDLDRFKLVNDTLGHQAGDTLLKVVAQRLRSVLRTKDTVARLGGDEFVIIQTGQGRAEDASRLAERLIDAMAAPVDLGGYPAGVGISIGIALAHHDGLDPDRLYARADQALYRAKAAGRNTFRLYTEEEAGSAGMSSPDGGRGKSQSIGPIALDPVSPNNLLRRNLESKQSAEALRIQEERYRLALLATEDAIWDWDLASDTIEWSERAHWLFGYSDADITGTGAWWKSKIHPDDRERVTASVHRVIDGQEHRWSEEYRFEQGDGCYAAVLDRGFVIRDAQGQAVRMVGAMHDVTVQRRADAALRASEERLRRALHVGRMTAWEHDLTTGQATRSENAGELLGIGSGSASQFFDQVHPDDRAELERFIQQGGPRTQHEFRYILPTGSMKWLSTALERVEEHRLVGITFDITERKMAEEQAWRAANHDALTALPNRRLFHQRLDQALAAAKRDITSVSLLLVDIDMLRDVNDTLGHDAGDAVLCEAASRLSEGLRDTDTVARLGGDEFALILAEPLRLEHAAKHAEVLLERMRRPFTYRGHALTCRASIGLAAYPDHHRNTRDLLKDVDIALYRAKAQGRNRSVVFAPAMRAETEQRVLIVAEVRAALAAGQIVPFYQPKVCFTTGAIAGLEALARWQHPEKGLLTPGYFGSAFEDPELATAIGDSMLRQVAADLRAWQERGLSLGRIAVNFASAEFRKPDLAGSILAVLGEHGVAATQFEVEVTETVFLGYGSENVPATLQKLHEAGVLITLDDFVPTWFRSRV
jgi:diguanylate cyclase (GGDEF)-like protein/PAS domain S-box-containing protein